MEEAILQALKSRQGTSISGEEMSRLCGVSRTAIWKEIEKLRAEGYKILAQPHIGYRLVSSRDRLTAQELGWGLKTKRFGKKIYAYEETSSTMDVAMRLAANKEPEGSVVVSEGQTKGRGRLGRNWVSPKGKGIYLSIILRPAVQLQEVPLLTLMAAVAVARAIEKETNLKPQIKWPNDVMLRGKKVAGILTELNAELNRVHAVILGIGINVNTDKRSLPAHATSLAQELDEVIATRSEAKGKQSRVELARRLLEELDKIYADCIERGFSSILEDWRGFAGFLGRRIRVATEGRTVDGQAVDVDSSGALLVRTDTGLIESVSAGEVLVVR
jgi:BirA family biotin operon repressor/biotin-[acetyl-CoA-carboxylase] ligase